MCTPDRSTLVRGYGLPSRHGDPRRQVQSNPVFNRGFRVSGIRGVFVRLFSGRFLDPGLWWEGENDLFTGGPWRAGPCVSHPLLSVPDPVKRRKVS